MRSTRVGLVCGYLDPVRDGVADYTRRLAGHLRAAGVDAVLCTTHALAAAHGEGAVGVTGRWDLPGVLTAARALRRLDLDLVHVQFAPSVYGGSRAVGLLPLLLPQRLVVTLHEYGVWAGQGYAAGVRSALWGSLERSGLVDRETLLLAPWAACCLVPAREHHDVLHARFGRRAPRSVEVPIGLNVELVSDQSATVRADVRRALGAQPSSPLVVFFGFLHPEKALDRLITAVADMKADHPDAQLLLIGGAESHSVPPAAARTLRSQLDQVAAGCRMQERVHFTGYLPDHEISRLLHAADVAAFPLNDGVTRKSGSLLTALEAGVPVVATAPAGEVSQPTEVGSVLRIPPRDTAALTAALRRVLGDPALAERLRSAGAEAAGRQTWNAIAAAHADVYAAAMAAASARGTNVDRRRRSGQGGHQTT